MICGSIFGPGCMRFISAFFSFHLLFDCTAFGDPALIETRWEHSEEFGWNSLLFTTDDRNDYMVLKRINR